MWSPSGNLVGKARCPTRRNRIKKRTNSAYQTDGGRGTGVLPVVHLPQEEPPSQTVSDLQGFQFRFPPALCLCSALIHRDCSGEVPPRPPTRTDKGGDVAKPSGGPSLPSVTMQALRICFQSLLCFPEAARARLSVHRGGSWWPSGKESPCPRRGQGFDPWPGTIPCASGQPSPCAPTAEPVLQSPGIATAAALEP